MRILVFGLTDNLGGTESVFNVLYEYARQKGCKFDFVAHRQTIALQQQYEKNGSDVFAVPNFIKHPIMYYKAINAVMRSKRYDAVHINMLSAANILPVMAAKRNKISNIILHSHNGGTVGIVRKVLHIINRPYLKNKHFIRVAVSEQSGKYLYGNSDFIVMKNAINTNRFRYDNDSRLNIRAKYSICPEDTLLGAVGRLSKEKNHVFLIDVLKQMKDNRVKLMIVGDGERRDQILDYAKRSGLANRVILVGAVNDIEKYYSAFDIFVMPSLYEGVSMASLEAQASGLRCILSSTISFDPDAISCSYVDLDASKWATCIEEILAGSEMNGRSITEGGNAARRNAELIVGLYNGKKPGVLS